LRTKTEIEQNQAPRTKIRIETEINLRTEIIQKSKILSTIFPTKSFVTLET